MFEGQMQWPTPVTRMFTQLNHSDGFCFGKKKIQRERERESDVKDEKEGIRNMFA